MSPERTTSPQVYCVETPKMSVPASSPPGTPINEAQSPISLLLAVAQAQNGNNRNTSDDDLTNLAWLHEKDLLKGMNINPSPSSSKNSTPSKYYMINNTLYESSPSDYIEESSVSPGESSNGSLQSCHSPSLLSNRPKHPHNIPYDPFVHINNKPPYSFSCLIFMAIEDSKEKSLPVKEIYSWIMRHFPYFQNAPIGWKNSVRHNLSLNKCFRKVITNLGKGSLWEVHPQYKPNLIQALTRAPFHPNLSIDPNSFLNNNNNSISNNNIIKNNKSNEVSSFPTARLPNTNLLPNLSKTFNYYEENVANEKLEEISKETLDDVDAAAVMLSLKNGPSNRQRRSKTMWQIITTSPSQDHTYSAANSSSNNEDSVESDEDRKITLNTRRKIDFEEDEEQKKIKGAEMLLNLAGISTRRSSSQDGESPPKRSKSNSSDVPHRHRSIRVKGKKRSNNNNKWTQHHKDVMLTENLSEHLTER